MTMKDHLDIDADVELLITGWRSPALADTYCFRVIPVRVSNEAIHAMLERMRDNLEAQRRGEDKRRIELKQLSKDSISFLFNFTGLSNEMIQICERAVGHNGI